MGNLFASKLENRLDGRQDKRGAERDAVGWVYFASIKSSLTEVNCGSLPLKVYFLFSPDPLLPALPCLRTSNNPPPPGRGTRQQISVRSSRRIHNPPTFCHTQFAHSRCSFAIAQFLGATVCPLLLASGRSRSFPLICGVSLPRHDVRHGKRGANQSLRFPILRLLQSTW